MNTKGICATILGTIFFLLFIALWAPYYSLRYLQELPWGLTAGAVIWGERAFDTIFQGFILLAGVISILLLVRPDTIGRRPP